MALQSHAVKLQSCAALAEIRDTLLETYASNDAMNQLILSHLDPRAWRAQPPGEKGKGRTIAAIFAHLHNCRLKWLKRSAPHFKWRRTIQMMCGTLQPLKTDVVQMREGCRAVTAFGFLSRRLSAPRTRVQMGEDELVHGVVARIGFEQGVANLGQRRAGLEFHRVGLECHGSSVNFT